MLLVQGSKYIDSSFGAEGMPIRAIWSTRVPGLAIAYRLKTPRKTVEPQHSMFDDRQAEGSRHGRQRLRGRGPGGQSPRAWVNRVGILAVS